LVHSNPSRRIIDVTDDKDSMMKLRFALALLGPIALNACSALPSLPPENVPVSGRDTFPAPPAQEQWRPYSAGPLQNRFERKPARPGTDWGTGQSQGRDKVERSALPAPSQDAAASPAERSATPERSTGWSAYPGRKEAKASSSSSSGDPASVFGPDVSSAWATDYVPEAFRDEFAIFAQKAARDGQGRMTMPTGEVYSASVTGRDGRCSTLEVGVTADGSLPIVSRGLVRACR
jgi:hypothetical protein